ncbi:flavin reductase, partial [Vibrio parahaemolyticus]
AHQCSAKYEEGVSEFKEVGLEPEYMEGIAAPFVKESHIKFGCELVQKIDIEWNGTYLIIGKIIKIVVPDEYIAVDGFIDLG